MEVGLCQQGPSVVGAGDRPELVVEETGPLGSQEVPQLAQIRRVVDQASGLFGFRGLLLVVRKKEESAVADDRAAEGEAELTAKKVRLACLNRHGVRRRDAVPLAEVVGGARQFVGARLRDHIHKPSGRPSELGRGTLVHHHHLLDRVLAEGEGRPLPAPLLAEEGVVEVGPVHDEVVEDAALAADVELISVGALRDRDAGSQKREVQVVAPVVGKPVNHLFGQAGRAGHILGVHEVLAMALDGYPLELDGTESQRQGQLLAHAQDQSP